MHRSLRSHLLYWNTTCDQTKEDDGKEDYDEEDDVDADPWFIPSDNVNEADDEDEDFVIL